MERRGFLAGILAAGFAPAAIGSGVLMPVRALNGLGRYPIHLHKYPSYHGILRFHGYDNWVVADNENVDFSPTYWIDAHGR